jgi:hypothetical protein
MSPFSAAAPTACIGLATIVDASDFAVYPARILSGQQILFVERIATNIPHDDALTHFLLRREMHQFNGWVG